MTSTTARRIWASLLTGVPFAVYKFGVGWFAHQHGWAIWGIVAMAWGVIDIALNLLAVALPATFGFCLLSNIGRQLENGGSRRSWEGIFIGIDTLIALSIVSCMSWFGGLPLEPPAMRLIWNLAVVANLSAVGLQKIWDEARRHQSATF